MCEISQVCGGEGGGWRIHLRCALESNGCWCDASLSESLNLCVFLSYTMLSIKTIDPTWEEEKNLAANCWPVGWVNHELKILVTKQHIYAGKKVLTPFRIATRFEHLNFSANPSKGFWDMFPSSLLPTTLSTRIDVQGPISIVFLVPFTIHINSSFCNYFPALILKHSNSPSEYLMYRHCNFSYEIVCSNLETKYFS